MLKKEKKNSILIPVLLIQVNVRFCETTCNNLRQLMASISKKRRSVLSHEYRNFVVKDTLVELDSV